MCPNSYPIINVNSVKCFCQSHLASCIHISTPRIVPQAICTRFGLAIGYYCSPIVLVLMAILFPISFPIAKLLDLILGKEHSTFFRRAGTFVGLAFTKGWYTLLLKYCGTLKVHVSL